MTKPNTSPAMTSNLNQDIMGVPRLSARCFRAPTLTGGRIIGRAPI